ncbi:MAG: hypothetical protein WBB19_01315 [Desulforhopalus sp.]
MVRTSLFLVLIAGVAFLAADISITTFDPWFELKRMAIGMVTPDFFSLPAFGRALFNTISFALIGIAGAVVLGFGLSLFFDYTPVRLFCAFIRAIHELFWAFIFMPIIGLNSFCGILAIAIPYAGVFAKVYAEIRQESDQRPTEALQLGTPRATAFFYTTLPLIYRDLKNYTSYRFECALRSSAILGFIGLPTLGYHLETAFREGMYSEAAALLYCFYLLILSLRFWARPRLILFPLIVAFIFTNWDASVSLVNIMRFFTYDILPWPLRAEGFYDGSQVVSLHPVQLFEWLKNILINDALPGIWNTVLLTQIVLVCTAAFTLLIFPLASRKFFSRKVTGWAHIVLIVVRTTPEYILAYIILQICGPSMLPAIIALSLHNGGILAYLTACNVNLMQLPFDSPHLRINRYFYEVLPRCYGQFLAFLFYRWEVIMRESAILGILGIYTLGHFIDSAISEDQLDRALILIIISAFLNMGIDTLSQRIRKSLHISAHFVARSSSSS